MKEPIKDNLDKLISAVKTDEPATNEIEAAAQRVRKILQKESELMKNEQTDIIGNENNIDETEMFNQPRLNSLQEYIDAIPDYLANRLSPEVTSLFEEEARSSMELRRALNSAKTKAKHSQNTGHVGARKSRRFAWLYSAAAAALLAITLIFVSPQLPSFDQSQLAQIEDVSGKLYRVVDGNLSALKAGDWIDGSQILRTAGKTTAMVMLDDGSRVEMGPRAEIQFMRRPHGNRIDVDRGKIIVTASKQGSGTLDVMTEEFMVSVKGTIFEVGHGANGSRVSVIEGKVEVHQRGDSKSITPGEQYATRIGKTELGIGKSITSDIAWSRNYDKYALMLKEVTALQQDVVKAMDSEPRYSKRLLNLAPENTVFYAAVPNAPEKIAEVYQVVRDRIRDSKILSERFDSEDLAAQFNQLDEVTGWLADMGDTLGDETVAILKLQKTHTQDDRSKPNHTQQSEAGINVIPVILSEVDADAFTENFESNLAKLREKMVQEQSDEKSDQTDRRNAEIEIAIIDDPSQASPNQLSIWLHEDLLVASIGVETFQEIEQAIEDNSSQFVNTGLYAQLVSYYDKGAKFLGGIDLETLLNLQEVNPELKAQSDSNSNSNSDNDSNPELGLEIVGLDNAQFLMLHHSQDSSEGNFSAELIFDGQRAGVMSWLAEAAPMGSLDFFSINTTFVNAFILKSPEIILNEIKKFSGDEWNSQGSENPNSEIAKEIVTDLAASFGGEVAFGLDGPALPTPSWKIVTDVNDVALLQKTIVRIIETVNNHKEKVNRHIEMMPVELDDYNAYQILLSITPEVDSERKAVEFSVFYAYIDGYLIATPNVAFLERAINQYQSGIGLLSSREFQSLLAQGSDFDVSALTFSRIGQLLSDLSKNLPNGLSRDQRQDLYKLRAENRKPSMLTVTAQADRIRLAHRGNFLPDFSSIMSMQSLARILLGNDEFFEEISEKDKAKEAAEKTE